MSYSDPSTYGGDSLVSLSLLMLKSGSLFDDVVVGLTDWMEREFFDRFHPLRSQKFTKEEFCAANVDIIYYIQSSSSYNMESFNLCYEKSPKVM